MAIGRSFQESLQKALRGLETGKSGLDPVLELTGDDEMRSTLNRELKVPGAERLWYVADACRAGWSLQEVHDQTAIDPWFLAEIEDLVATEEDLVSRRVGELDADQWYALKRKGFSDSRLAVLLGTSETDVRHARQGHGIRPVFRRVDTCAAEFPTASA